MTTGRGETEVTGRGGGRGTGRFLPPAPLMVALSVVTMATAAVYAYCSMTQSSILTVHVPTSAKLRKVRSFTDQPDLSEVTLNISTLHANFRIMDSTDCETDSTKCSTYAVCDNQQGEMICKCMRGYYLDGKQCRACRTSCPSEHYMLQPCTTTRDVVCSACTVCKDQEYEITPCRAAQNRKCIDVTFPMQQIKHGETRCTRLAGNNSIQLMPSGNVFVERLNNVKELETTMYVTNNQQAMDFIWKRESGLEVKVSVTDVYLVPEYIDIDHQDDNQYFLGSSFTHSEVKQTFRNILKNYCRHPLPDHYNMILEVHPNRSTSAIVVTCDSTNSSVPRCPITYTDGEKYVMRSWNEACPKMQGRGLMKLHQAANSIVCLDESPILTAVFGLKTANVSEVMFRSKECNNYTKSCQSCIQKACRNINPFRVRFHCCQIPCYTSYSCQKSSDSLCPPSPVECATGDAYVFTLRPMFNSITSRFFCHLHYKKPAKLYSINYNVQLPRVGYRFKKRHQTVTAKSTQFHEHGIEWMDFIAIEHLSQMPVNSETILVKELMKTGYSLHALKGKQDFYKKFDVTNPKQNIFSSDIQFSKPFEYSAMTWHNKGCFKGTPEIYPAQTVFRPNGTPVNALKTILDGKFHYHISQAKETPQIKLLIESNRSILSSYQKDFQDATLNARNLGVKLYWEPVLGHWMMILKGVLSSCPGYLKMKIYDTQSRVCYGDYDIFINCPPTFQISAVLAEWGLPHPSILTVMLSDSENTHKLHLTTHRLDTNFSSPASSSYSILKLRTEKQSPWKLVIAILISTGILAVIIVITLMALRIFKLSKRMEPAPVQDERRSSLLSGQEQEQEERSQESPRPPRQTSKGIIMFFVFIYIFYSFFFTLSVTLGLFYVILGPSISTLRNATMLSLHVQQNVNKCLTEIKDHENREMTYMLSLIKQRQHACRTHLDKEVADILREIQTSVRQVLSNVYQDNGLLQKTVRNLFLSKQLKLKKKINDFVVQSNSSLKQQLSSFNAKYINFLKNVIRNKWLAFPKKLFEQHGTIHNVMEAEESLLEYMKWMEVDKVDQISSVHEIILERMDKSKPVFYGSAILASDSHKGAKSIWNKLYKVLDDSHWFVAQTRHVFKYFLSEDFDHENEVSHHLNLYIHPNHSWENGLGGKTFLSILVGLFVLLDSFLLVYRFKWMQKMLSQIKSGYVQKMPMDSIASKVYAIRTGKDAPRAYSPLEHPYNYYQENKDNIWSSNELCFCQNLPKSKEDILKEIWSHRRRQKSKLKRERFKDFCFVQYFIRFCKTILRVLGSKLFLKFTLFALIVFFLCIFLSLADRLITADSIQLFLDRHLGGAQLEDHLHMSDTSLTNYAAYLNQHLDFIKKFVDWEIADFNAILEGIRENQRQLLDQMLIDICSIIGNYSSSLPMLCSSPSSLPTTTITSCNFMSIQPHFYDGIIQELSVQLLQNNLTSVEIASRHLVFHTIYLLLFFLCGMLLCHTAAQVMDYYLFYENKIPILRIYQTTSSSSPWPDHHNCTVKDMHRSASWLQSSESGVYLGDNEETVRESTM